MACYGASATDSHRDNCKTLPCLSFALFPSTSFFLGCCPLDPRFLYTLVKNNLFYYIIATLHIKQSLVPECNSSAYSAFEFIYHATNICIHKTKLSLLNSLVCVRSPQDAGFGPFFSGKQNQSKYQPFESGVAYQLKPKGIVVSSPLAHVLLNVVISAVCLLCKHSYVLMVVLASRLLTHMN